jgi:hypothetical protein
LCPTRRNEFIGNLMFPISVSSQIGERFGPFSEF